MVCMIIRYSDIRSISKSIVFACVGIAFQQGKIKSINQKVFDFFPEYAKQDTGVKSLLTIKHLLTMSSGLAWNEDVPYEIPFGGSYGYQFWIQQDTIMNKPIFIVACVGNAKTGLKNQLSIIKQELTNVI